MWDLLFCFAGKRRNGRRCGLLISYLRVCPVLQGWSHRWPGS
jgi:hypothetical protein